MNLFLSQMLEVRSSDGIEDGGEVGIASSKSMHPHPQNNFRLKNIYLTRAMDIFCESLCERNTGLP